MNDSRPPVSAPRPSALALSPLLLFLLLFFGAGLYFTGQGEAMGFYQLRAPVAILPALALGAWLAWRRGLKPVDTLLAGMGHSNVMLMVLVFLLAGAFGRPVCLGAARRGGARHCRECRDSVPSIALDSRRGSRHTRACFPVSG